MKTLLNFLFNVVIGMLAISFCGVLVGIITAVLGGIGEDIELKQIGKDMVLYGLGGLLFTVLIPGSVFRLIAHGDLKR